MPYITFRAISATILVLVLSAAGAGTVITGYASETSVAPGQSFHLHVAAPAGSHYRVLVYRLGWYQGVGGRLIMWSGPGMSCGANLQALSGW